MKVIKYFLLFYIFVFCTKTADAIKIIEINTKDRNKVPEIFFTPTNLKQKKHEYKYEEEYDELIEEEERQRAFINYSILLSYGNEIDIPDDEYSVRLSYGLLDLKEFGIRKSTIISLKKDDSIVLDYKDETMTFYRDEVIIKMFEFNHKDSNELI